MTFKQLVFNVNQISKTIIFFSVPCLLCPRLEFLRPNTLQIHTLYTPVFSSNKKFINLMTSQLQMFSNEYKSFTLNQWSHTILAASKLRRITAFCKTPLLCRTVHPAHTNYCKIHFLCAINTYGALKPRKQKRSNFLLVFHRSGCISTPVNAHHALTALC